MEIDGVEPNGLPRLRQWKNRRRESVAAKDSIRDPGGKFGRRGSAALPAEDSERAGFAQGLDCQFDWSGGEVEFDLCPELGHLKPKE
ncbi:MAG: hypothetical protein ACREFR_19755 [Limisphaerales bacterium]